MEKRFDKLEEKMDIVSDKLDVVDKHLAVYNEQLKEHIRRTEILEANVEPVKRHVSMVNGVFRFLAYLAGLVGLIELFKR
jgi:archaellum component FlaC